MLVRMRKEMGAEEPTVTPEIDTLILIDRYPLLLPSDFFSSFGSIFPCIKYLY